MVRQSPSTRSLVSGVCLLAVLSLHSPVTATFFDPFELFCDTPECTASTFIPKPPPGVCQNGSAPVVTLCAADGDVNGDDGHLQLKIEGHVISSCSFGLTCSETMSRVPQPRNCGLYLDEPFVAPVNHTLLNVLAHATPSLVQITVDNHNSGAGGGCPYQGHFVYASARFSCRSPGQTVLGSPSCPPLTSETFSTAPPTATGTAPIGNATSAPHPVATTASPTTTPPTTVRGIYDEIPLRCQGPECVASAIVSKPSSASFCTSGRLVLTVCAGDGDVNGDDGHLLLKLNGVQVAACSFASAGVCYSSKTPSLRNCGYEPNGNQFVFTVNRTLVTSVQGKFLSLTLDNNDSGAGFGCPFFGYHLFAYARFSCLPDGVDEPLASPSCPPLTGQAFPTTTSPAPITTHPGPSESSSPVHSFFTAIPLSCVYPGCTARSLVLQPEDAVCANDRELTLTLCAADGDINGDDGHLQLKLDGTPIGSCSFGSDGVCTSGKVPQLRSCGHSEPGHPNIFVLNKTMVTHPPSRHMVLTLDANGSGAGSGCPYAGHSIYAFARFACLPPGSFPPQINQCPPLSQYPDLSSSTQLSTTPGPAAGGGLLLREAGASVSFGEDGQVRLSRTGNTLDVSSEVRVGGMKVQETMQQLLAEVASLRRALNMSLPA